ncbi:FMR1-interacting protein NUFIP1-like [Rhopilema esculentum]|uniref:FMR1-interacting protein NUFIP1-like n=1 Tax=Rhopilema esculentum TaxID=499914 RepID=UPI0031E3A590
MAGVPNGYIFPPPRKFTPEVWQRPPNFFRPDLTFGPSHYGHEVPRPPFLMATGQRFMNGVGPNCGMQWYESQQPSGYEGNAQPPQFSNFVQQNKLNFHGDKAGYGRGVDKMSPATGKAVNKMINKDEKMMFFCEPCEKEFKTLADKTMHLKGHVKCEVKGCTFIASRKILKLHFIQNHEEGRFRISLQSDADIKKWRDERKKNYPSLFRQKAKIENEEEKKRKGHVLETKLYSYRGNDSWHIKNPKKIEVKKENQEMNNNCKDPLETVSKEPNPNKKPDEQSAHIVESKANALTGLQLMYDSSPSEDENENDFYDFKETKTIKPGLCSDIAPDDVIKEEKVDTNETPCGKGNSFSEGPACKDSITKHGNKNQCLDDRNSHEENLQNYSQTSCLKEQKSGQINQGKRQLSQRDVGTHYPSKGNDLANQLYWKCFWRMIFDMKETSFCSA